MASGASAGKTQALALEPSGGFSPRIAGALAGMTQAVTRLGWCTKAPTHGFPCGPSLSCMALGSETVRPGRAEVAWPFTIWPPVSQNHFHCALLAKAVTPNPPNSREEEPSCHLCTEGHQQFCRLHMLGGPRLCRPDWQEHGQ